MGRHKYVRLGLGTIATVLIILVVVGIIGTYAIKYYKSNFRFFKENVATSYATITNNAKESLNIENIAYYNSTQSFNLTLTNTGQVGINIMNVTLTDTRGNIIDSNVTTASGGIQFDNPGVGNSSSAGNKYRLTLNSFTVENHPNRILIVTAGSESNSGLAASTCRAISVSYGAIANLTRATEYNLDPSSGNDQCDSIWYLINPPVGSAKIVITYAQTGGASIQDMSGGALSLYNAAQQGPESTASHVDENSPGGIVTSIHTLSDTDLVVDAVGSGNPLTPPCPNTGGPITAGFGQDQAYSVGAQSGSSSSHAVSTMVAPSAGTIYMTETQCSLRLVHLLVAFKPTISLPPAPVATTIPGTICAILPTKSCTASITYHGFTDPITFSIKTATNHVYTTTVAPVVSWYDNQWQYRNRITIDPTKVAGTVTNFPLLVNITAMNLASSQTTGSDILFTAYDGRTKLKHELERQNATTIQVLETQTGSTATDPVTPQSQVGLRNNISIVTGQLYLASISNKYSSAHLNPVTSVSGGLGLTWTKVASQCGYRDQDNTELWMAVGTTTAASANITATFTSAFSNGGTHGGAVISVSRFSGVDTANPIGAVKTLNTYDGTCGGSSLDSASYSFPFITTTNGAMIWSTAGERLRSHTPGSGFTEITDLNTQAVGGDSAGVAIEDKTVKTPGSVIVSGTFSSTLDWSIIAVEIRPSGTGLAWVKVPALYSEPYNIIYMYYGNPNALDQQNVTKTWDINYTGVWHFDQNPAGPIGFDNVQSIATSTDSNKQVSLPFTVGTGEDRLLLVGAGTDNSAVTSVTYGSQSLTKKIENATNPKSSIWYLTNPPSGTNTLTMTSGAASTKSVLGAYSLFNVDQANPIPTTVIGGKFNTTMRIAITTAYANSWVFDYETLANGNGGTPFSNPKKTVGWNLPNTDDTVGSSFDGPLAKGIQAQFGWDFTGVADSWNALAVEIKQTTGPIPDSTSNANDLNGSKISSSNLVWGKFGGSINLVSASSQYLNRTSNLNNMPANNAAQTGSFWYWVSANPATQTIYSLQNTGAASYLQTGFSGSNSAAWKGSAGGTILVSSAPLTAGSWHYFVYTFNPTVPTNLLYLDGVQKTPTNTAPNASPPNALYVGAYSGGQYFNGKIDELRISNTVRPPEWIQTEYNNQVSPSTFYTVGPQEYYNDMRTSR